MRLNQVEGGVSVIEGVFFPAGRAVTVAAIATVAPLMVVISSVAVDAATGKRVLEILPGVTVIARQIVVTGIQ